MIRNALYQILKDKVGDFISIGSLPSGVYPFENSLTKCRYSAHFLKKQKTEMGDYRTVEPWYGLRLPGRTHQINRRLVS